MGSPHNGTFIIKEAISGPKLYFAFVISNPVIRKPPYSGRVPRSPCVRFREDPLLSGLLVKGGSANPNYVPHVALLQGNSHHRTSLGGILKWPGFVLRAWPHFMGPGIDRGNL